MILANRSWRNITFCVVIVVLCEQLHAVLVIYSTFPSLLVSKAGPRAADSAETHLTFLPATREVVRLKTALSPKPHQ